MRWRTFVLVLAACEVIAAVTVGNEMMSRISNAELGGVLDAVTSLDLGRILSLIFD